MEIMIDMDKSQRESIKRMLTEMGLAELQEQVENIIFGSAPPLTVLQILETFWRVGWLRGQQAVIEKHNHLYAEMASPGAFQN